ncbi:hypothetical protein MAR_017103 [Mya arenaria]|uniref:Uncharacterized protein n=1 Tax=Mya arenaria TaxID=6604 RepID=A0ABY7EAT1_MYAAR|nr:hypothetical protein MAR_017103 [Mya arenaria]
MVSDRFMPSDEDLPDALETYQNIQKKSHKRYKLRVCRDWNNRCSSWTKDRFGTAVTGSHANVTYGARIVAAVPKYWAANT